MSRPSAKLHATAWKIAYAPILTAKHIQRASIQREVLRGRRLLTDNTRLRVAQHDRELMESSLNSDFEDEPEAKEFDSQRISAPYQRSDTGPGLLEEPRYCESPTPICVGFLTGVEAGPKLYEEQEFRAKEDPRQNHVFLGDRSYCFAT